MKTETELSMMSTPSLRELRDSLPPSAAAELEQVNRELWNRWLETTPQTVREEVEELDTEGSVIVTGSVSRTVRIQPGAYL